MIIRGEKITSEHTEKMLSLKLGMLALHCPKITHFVHEPQKYRESNKSCLTGVLLPVPYRQCPSKCGQLSDSAVGRYPFVLSGPGHHCLACGIYCPASSCWLRAEPTEPAGSIGLVHCQRLQTFPLGYGGCAVKQESSILRQSISSIVSLTN